jgi:hypothetical protein
MKFRHLNNGQIDKQKWDEAINQSTLPLLYAQSWFLDIVMPNWHALVAGDYDMVMPIPNKKKWLIPYIAQPIFTQQLGLFAKGGINDTHLLQLVKYLTTRYPFVAYHFNRDNCSLLQQKNIRPRQTFELNLNKSYTTLLENTSRSHRKNIDKANKMGVYVVQNQNPHPFIQMLKEMYQTKGVDEIKPSNFDSLLKLANYGLANTNSVLYDAFAKDNNRIGSALFLRSGKQLIQFMARTPEGMEKRSAFALVNQLLIDQAQSDCYLDFAGSDLTGVAEFNAGWGAQKYFYPVLKGQWLNFK